MENELKEIESVEIVPNEVGSIYTDLTAYDKYYKIAQGLSKSDMVPVGYKGNADNCMLALDVARQLGASPLQVMQSLYIVRGKVSWSGQFCAGVVKASFNDVEVEFKGKTDEDLGCRVIAKDPYTNKEIKGTWVTMKMAKAEGWVDKDGSKWKTMPVQMLQYRAFTFFARVHCPNKLLGIHDEYEIEDIKQSRKLERVQNLEDTLLNKGIDE